MPLITVNAKNISYLDRGTSVPVVFLHAGAGSGRQWTKIAEQLEDRIRIIAPDLWGFGGTDRWDGESDLSHDDQARLVDELVNTVVGEPVHLVGHSYGGATAIRYVMMRPEKVLSLTVIEPILMPLLKQTGETALFEEYDAVASGFIEAVARGEPDVGWKKFLDYRNGEGAWERLSEAARVRFLAITENNIAGYKSNLGNPTTLQNLREIGVRTLVICGSKTTLPDRKVSEIVRDTIPNCRYEVIPDAEHMSPVTHPNEVAGLIASHLHG
jgi:lipase